MSAATSAAPARRIAVLVNAYPKVSHTFVRREILALEALGWSVRRFAIRASDEELPDPADRAELERTTVLLAGGPLAFTARYVRALARGLARPRQLGRGLALAWRLGGRAQRGRSVQFAYLLEALELLRQLAREPVEHLHVHFSTNGAAVALLARALGGPPYSFTAHGTETCDDPTRLALDLKVAHARFVVAASDYCRSQLLRWSAHADWERVHVVRCGLDASHLDAPAEPPELARRFVLVGRMSPEKGHSIALRALALLAAEGEACELVLVGDGELRDALEREARALGLGHAVHFAGWLEGEAVRAQIVRSRALLAPSLAEGLPVVLTEALALRRPVVATRVAGVPELVRPGENGWLASAGSVRELAGALRAALQANASELERLGAAGARLVREQHDARREAARLSRLLEAPQTALESSAAARAEGRARASSAAR
jgi:colanic acid/amylovoran biosynthesis glycosyltransferase